MLCFVQNAEAGLPGIMATIKIYDRADQFRVEIVGRFAGEPVREVFTTWANALRETAPRRFAVDITRLTSYDHSGCKLLRDMYRHGVQFAAGTPLSLVFLGEISSAPRQGPALVREKPSERPAEEPKSTPAARATAGRR
jgi:hypothetical protein